MKQNQEISQPTDQRVAAVTRRSMLNQTGGVAIALFGLRFLPAANLFLNPSGCRTEPDDLLANSGDVGSDLQAACDKSDREQFLHWVGEHMLAGAREQMTREDGPDHV